MKATALVVYPIHTVILNFTVAQRRYLIAKGFNLVAFMTVGTGGFIREGNDEEGGSLKN